MITAGELRKGVTFEYEGKVYVVVDFLHVKPGKGAAFVRTKLKNVITGQVIEMTFNPVTKFEKAQIERKQMQYLYSDGDLYYFMDNETYDQLEIPSDRLKWELNFLKPSDEVEVTSHEGEVLGVALPINVALTITETEPAVKGDTATGATKNAVLETGYQIKVPLFISEGEVVMVNTQDGKYQGRA